MITSMLATGIYQFFHSAVPCSLSCWHTSDGYILIRDYSLDDIKIQYDLNEEITNASFLPPRSTHCKFFFYKLEVIESTQTII